MCYSQHRYYARENQGFAVFAGFKYLDWVICARCFDARICFFLMPYAGNKHLGVLVYPACDCHIDRRKEVGFYFIAKKISSDYGLYAVFR
jgi:hypothetical protein